MYQQSRPVLLGVCIDISSLISRDQVMWDVSRRRSMILGRITAWNTAGAAEVQVLGQIGDT